MRLRRAIGERPEAVVHAYLQAIGAGDFERARRYLSDGGFTQRSPIGAFGDADAYIADISRIGQILQGIEARRTFVDGDEVCVIADYTTHLDRRVVTPVVHWMVVKHGKIVSIETIFDASEYVKLFDVE